MTKYNDFKEYIQKNNLIDLHGYLQEYIDCEYRINERSDYICIIDNLKVKALSCFDVYEDQFKMDIGVCCKLQFRDRESGSILDSHYCEWYTIHTTAEIDDKLCLTNLGVEKYDKNKPLKKNSYSQFLVPYLNNAKLEDIADKFVSEIYKDYNPNKKYRLPHKAIEDKFNLKVYSAELPDDCNGRIFFRPAEIKSRVGTLKGVSKVESGTVLLNWTKDAEKDDFIYAHEITHWFLHKMYYKILALLRDKPVALSYDANPGPYSDTMTAAEKAHWFTEWQANAMAVKLNMPRIYFLEQFYKGLGSNPSPVEVETAIERTASHFNVSVFMAKKRAR